jgi:hypothetical protein
MYLCVDESAGHKSLKEVKLISSTHKYIKRGKIDILSTDIHRKR